MNKTKNIFILQMLILIFSIGSIFSKLASQQELFSSGFALCYLGQLLCLAIYAIGWQQILKIFPLTIAYTNKAMTIVWGLTFGYIFFKDRLSAGKILGAVLVIVGVVMLAMCGDEWRKS